MREIRLSNVDVDELANMYEDIYDKKLSFGIDVTDDDLSVVDDDIDDVVVEIIESEIDVVEDTLVEDLEVSGIGVHDGGVDNDTYDVSFEDDIITDDVETVIEVEEVEPIVMVEEVDEVSIVKDSKNDVNGLVFEKGMTLDEFVRKNGGDVSEAEAKEHFAMSEIRLGVLSSKVLKHKGRLKV